jgi:hypothetical protein
MGGKTKPTDDRMCFEAAPVSAGRVAAGQRVTLLKVIPDSGGQLLGCGVGSVDEGRRIGWPMPMMMAKAVRRPVRRVPWADPRKPTSRHSDKADLLRDETRFDQIVNAIERQGSSLDSWANREHLRLETDPPPACSRNTDIGQAP